MYNNRDNVIESIENGVFCLRMDFKKKESGMSDKLLTSWVKVDKKVFDRIKRQVQNAKTNNLQARRERDGSPIYLNKSYKLI